MWKVNQDFVQYVEDRVMISAKSIINSYQAGDYPAIDSALKNIQAWTELLLYYKKI
jgi:hypothetical protein